MPYIKTLFTEAGFLTEMKDLLVANGWTLESTFKKLGYRFSDMFYRPGFTYNDNDMNKFKIYYADHVIVRNATGELFGIARINSSEKIYRDLPTKFKDTLNVKHPASENLVTDSTLRDELHRWMMEQRNENLMDASELFFYMLKDLPIVDSAVLNVYPLDTPQGVIDVENLGYRPISTTSGNGSSYSFEVQNSHPEIMQSPMMRVKTREVGTTTNGWMTNWWPDSKISVEGSVSAETVALIIQCDNTAAYADNNVPTIPIYMGQLVPKDPADTNESVLFGGTAVADPEYDYRSEIPHTAVPIMPINKSYPKNPGNGIDNLIVKRGRLGAYYQANSLSFFTTSDKMPPDRISKDGRSYASSWKNQENEEYQYRFNPSSYYDKVVVSHAEVVHPEEGVRGHLKDMLMTSSIGLVNTDRLRMKREACPDVFDLYKYFVVDAVSPMTKSPAIATSPAGFAVFEKEAN